MKVKITVVMFFEEETPYCVSEKEHLEQLYKEAKEYFQIKAFADLNNELKNREVTITLV